MEPVRLETHEARRDEPLGSQNGHGQRQRPDAARLAPVLDRADQRPPQAEPRQHRQRTEGQAQDQAEPDRSRLRGHLKAKRLEHRISPDRASQWPIARSYTAVPTSSRARTGTR